MYYVLGATNPSHDKKYHQLGKHRHKGHIYNFSMWRALTENILPRKRITFAEKGVIVEVYIDLHTSLFSHLSISKAQLELLLVQQEIKIKRITMR